MKKFLIISLIIITLAVTAVYFLSGFIFNAAADKLIPQLLPYLASRGIDISDYNYKSIKFSSVRTITVYDVHIKFNLKLTRQRNIKYESFFLADKINFYITDLKKTAFILSCDNFKLYVNRTENFPGTTFGRFDHGYLQMQDPVLLSNLRIRLKKMQQDISNLFNEKNMASNIIIRALVTLKVRGKKSQANLFTVIEEGHTSLRFKEKDIKKMAATFEIKLSHEEAAIIARYPVRAPAIIRITSEAETFSRHARKTDRSVPEDAYRHVLWSYMLTQEFGNAFAEKVTDAHETLPTNTAAERKMDFHNNRIGREYANQGVNREKILWLVKNDRQVIKYPHNTR